MKYYSGLSNSDNEPKALPFNTFAQFVTEHLTRPVVCHVTAADYAAMDHREQGRVKNTRYFTAAAFKGDGRRQMRNIESINMLVLDVDIGADPLLAADLETLLPWNYCLWHTLTSTPTQPRLRLVVDTTPLDIDQYKAGVAWLAARLRLEPPNPNPESLNPAQPWYHPSVFSDRANDMPIFSSRVGGKAAHPSEWGCTAQDKSPRTVAVTPVEGVSLEQAEQLLLSLNPDEGYEFWIKAGMALKHQFGDEGLALWDDWSQRGPKYTSFADLEAKWESFKRQDDNPVTFRWIIKRVGDVGPSGASRSRIEQMIASSATVDVLGGPVLKAIHASVLRPVDVDILISQIKARARAAHGVSLRTPTLRGILDNLEQKNTTIPAEMQGFVYVTELNLWVDPVRGVRIMPPAFDLSFAKHLPGRPSVEALVALGMRQVDREGYEPTRPTELIYRDSRGVTYLNTYRQSYPEADPQTSAQAGEIINAHLELLFPAPTARDLLLSWMTWCLSNPGQKCHWHVFIQGVQGCGKSLVAEALAACFGSTNSRKVGNRMLTEKFNSWSDKVLFLYFEEVLLGDRQKDIMETIKDMVTGKTANIRAMRTDAVERPNHIVGGMFLSNHYHGLRIEHSDRRFFILCCEQQTETQVRSIPPKHFAQLARLKSDLAGGFRHYLLNRPVSTQFDPYGHAPNTADRELVLRAGGSEVDHAIQNAVESGDYDLITPEALAIDALATAVRSDLKHTSAKAMARALTEMGWKRLGQRMLANGDQHSIWFHPERLNGASPIEHLNASISAKEIL